MKVLDLFSGCGGFSYGFQEAGFNVVLGIDNVKIALDTFKYNHKNSEVFLKDLSKDEDIKEIVNYVDNQGGVDIIIAGPPCQGFSLTGSRKENDERNKLFYSVFKIAKLLKTKPKAIIIENVPGLATLYKGKAKIEIEKKFLENGYIEEKDSKYIKIWEVMDPYLTYLVYVLPWWNDEAEMRFWQELEKKWILKWLQSHWVRPGDILQIPDIYTGSGHKYIVFNNV